LAIANSKPLSNEYVAGTVDDIFLREVVKLSYFNNGPALAKEYLEKHGIQLITLTHLSKTYLDGVVITPLHKNPVIGLTLKYDRIDNFWFCLLHELAHLSRHLGINDNCLIVDDLDLRKYDDNKIDNIEREADRIAQEALVPGEKWDELGVSGDIVPGQVQILGLAKELKINPAIIAGRIRYEINDYRKFSNLLGHGEIRKQFISN